MALKNLSYNNLIVPSAILGVALILSAVIGSYVFNKVQSLGNVLSVTGSAKQSVTADTAKWVLSTSRIVPESGVISAYASVSANALKIKEYLIKNGIATDGVAISPVFVDEYWSGNNQVRQLNVHQDITVTSKDVHKIKTLSENLGNLAQQGVTFSPQSPQYFVSNLPELRVSLLGQAVTDAHRRAEEIGKSTGQTVGKLKSASSGVVQVVQSNSIDVSDYGQYDTSTIEKDVMVTVRAVFLVR